MKGELTAMKSLLSKAYENEARARVLAEKEAAAQAMEKHALERELHGYKKVVDKMVRERLQACPAPTSHLTSPHSAPPDESQARQGWA